MLRYSSVRVSGALIRNAAPLVTSSPSYAVISTRASSRSTLTNTARSSCHNITRLNRTTTTTNRVRLLSSKGGPEGGEESKELVLTPGQKVVVGTRLTMYAGIAVFASCCAYYIGKELLPSKMSPNTVFDKSFSLIKNNSEVSRRFGEPLKAYGRDYGGKREGRRNFVEHTEYTDKEDGSKRTRVKYNLEGKFGMAAVFAEVSNEMSSGEFVYILVQDKQNGRVITVEDNRSRLATERMMKGNKEGMDAFSSLLGSKSNRN